MKANRSPRTPLTPLERHARSRRLLTSRVFGAIAAGRSLTAIARRRNMPRVRTFRRWLAADPRLRQSYDTALMVQTHVMLDDKTFLKKCRKYGTFLMS